VTGKPRGGSSRGASSGSARAAGPSKKRRAPRPRRHKEVLTAGALVAETLAGYGLSEAVRTYRIDADWEELVGERIARRARPLGVQRRVLQVQVQSSSWLHELGLLKHKLLEALWSALGEPRLFDDMAFQLAGRSRANADAPGVAPSARRPPLPPLPLPPMAIGKDRDLILAETAAIDDAELRDLVARVRTRHNR
jgi:Dna[CI] antecedent, DciA